MQKQSTWIIGMILILILTAGFAPIPDGFVLSGNSGSILIAGFHTAEGALRFSLSLRQDEESAAPETVNRQNVFTLIDGKVDQVADEFTTLYRDSDIPLAVSRMDFAYPFAEKIAALDEFQVIFSLPELIVGDANDSETVRIPLEKPIALIFNSRAAGTIGDADPIEIEYPIAEESPAGAFELRTNNQFEFKFENLSVDDQLTFDWIVEGDYLKSIVLENPETLIAFVNRNGAFGLPEKIETTVSDDNDSTEYTIQFELSVPEGMNRENINEIRFDLGNPQFRLKYLNEKLEPSLWIGDSELPIRMDIKF